jgi:hypothetical protein
MCITRQDLHILKSIMEICRFIKYNKNKTSVRFCATDVRIVRHTLATPLFVTDLRAQQLGRWCVTFILQWKLPIHTMT